MCAVRYFEEWMKMSLGELQAADPQKGHKFQALLLRPLKQHILHNESPTDNHQSLSECFVWLHEQQTWTCLCHSFKVKALNLQSSDFPVIAHSHGPLPLPLSSSQLPSQLGKEPTGRKGRRSNGDGQEDKPRKKRSEAKVCYIFIYLWF